MLYFLFIFWKAEIAINPSLQPGPLDLPDTPTGGTKSENWYNIEIGPSLPASRNLFGWLLRILWRGEMCEWAHANMWAHMEMSTNIKSPALPLRAPSIRDGVGTAAEATIKWEVPGLTQEVWSVHLARLITNINRSQISLVLGPLEIFMKKKKMQLTF